MRCTRWTWILWRSLSYFTQIISFDEDLATYEEISLKQISDDFCCFFATLVPTSAALKVQIRIRNTVDAFTKDLIRFTWILEEVKIEGVNMTSIW